MFRSINCIWWICLVRHFVYGDGCSVSIRAIAPQRINVAFWSLSGHNGLIGELFPAIHNYNAAHNEQQYSDGDRRGLRNGQVLFHPRDTQRLDNALLRQGHTMKLEVVQ